MVSAPELKSVSATLARRALATNPQYMDKKLSVQLNGARKVIGTLRGFDVRCHAGRAPAAPAATNRRSS